MPEAVGSALWGKKGGNTRPRGLLAGVVVILTLSAPAVAHAGAVPSSLLGRAKAHPDRIFDVIVQTKSGRPPIILAPTMPGREGFSASAERRGRRREPHDEARGDARCSRRQSAADGDRRSRKGGNQRQAERPDRRRKGTGRRQRSARGGASSSGVDRGVGNRIGPRSGRAVRAATGSARDRPSPRRDLVHQHQAQRRRPSPVAGQREHRQRGAGRSRAPDRVEPAGVGRRGRCRVVLGQPATTRDSRD